MKLDAKRSACARTKNPGATINARSFEATRERGLRIFPASVTRLEALTEDDSKKLVEAFLSVPNVDETDTIMDGRGEKPLASSADPGEGSGDQDRIQGKENPTSSLSTAAQDIAFPPRSEIGGRSAALSVGQESGCIVPRRGSGEQEGAEKRIVPFPGESEPNLKGSEENTERLVASSESSAAIFRVLRATVLVLGGCGLGPLPSDKALWRTVKPMLLDGSLPHRVRHFDRR